MKFSKVRDVKTPSRGHKYDAGIDFFVPNDMGITIVSPGKQCIIDTGIKVDVPEGYALIAFNKSGVATGKQLLVGACVIDHGYQGTININLHNVSNESQLVRPGEKIVQFVLMKLGNHELLEVDEKSLYESVSDRGTGKFGSTGTD